MENGTTVSESYYHLQFPYQGKDGINLLESIPLVRGNVVLDLGCGTGYLSNVLATKVGREGGVIGVDPNSERLEIAKRLYSQVHQLKFLVADSESFPEGNYDVVFANQVVQWIKSKENLFQKVFNNLKIGGYFAFLCPADSGDGFFELLNPNISDKLYYWSSEQYKALALKCGFVLHRVSVMPATHHFETVEHLTKWLSATMGIENTLQMVQTVTNAITEPKFDWTKIEVVLKRIQ